MDNWFFEFECIALAKEEDQEAKQQIFQRLSKGKALKWYQDVPYQIKNI